MLKVLFEYQFIQNAVFAGILASIVCGIIGVIIVEKRLVMMSGGIAHTSYGGVGLCYLLGFEPIVGAFFMSILAAFGIGYIKRHGGTKSEVAIGLFWSLGMALGIFFIAMMPGYPPDMSSYLFGNILSVTQSDLMLIFTLTLCVVAVVYSLFDYWKAYLFDEEFSSIIGMRTSLLEYLLFILIALAVVVLIRVVGIILVMALFTAPTAISALVTRGLKNRMLLAIVLGAFFCLAGLGISYAADIPSGALIVLLSSMTYFFLYGALRWRKGPQEV